MYAFKCCTTDINHPGDFPGHCSHLIPSSDPLEEHNRELDRLPFGAEALIHLKRKEAYEDFKLIKTQLPLQQPDLK